MSVNIGATSLRGDLVRLEPLTEDHVPGLARAAEEDRAAYGYTMVPRAHETEAYVEAQRTSDGITPFAGPGGRRGAGGVHDDVVVAEEWPQVKSALTRRIQRLRCLAAAATGAGDNRSVSTIERPLPPLNADERTTLESWLEFHRATLAMKCEGLDDAQAAAASVPPSGFTLTGLVQHMAEVERNWFRRVLAGEQAPPIYDPQADPNGPDGGFELAQGATLSDALATWRAEIGRAREQCAARALGDTGRFAGQDVSLRWIYVHMIEEYARHNGHADLVRERIDGTTGV